MPSMNNTNKCVIILEESVKHHIECLLRRLPATEIVTPNTDNSNLWDANRLIVSEDWYDAQTVENLVSLFGEKKLKILVLKNASKSEPQETDVNLAKSAFKGREKRKVITSSQRINIAIIEGKPTLPELAKWLIKRSVKFEKEEVSSKKG